MIVGIVPAAGKAERFGGAIKELLPCAPGQTLVDRTLTAMGTGKANAIHVVTSSEKLSLLEAHITPRWSSVYYSIQSDPRDLYGAVRQGIKLRSERYFFAMPDTIYPLNAFLVDDGKTDLILGLFETNQPERFGVVSGGKILDKNQSLRGMKAFAWGVLIWSEAVADFWIRNDKAFRGFPEALSYAMAKFKWGDFRLGSYRDVGTYDDYVRAIRS